MCLIRFASQPSSRLICLHFCSVRRWIHLWVTSFICQPILPLGSIVCISLGDAVRWSIRGPVRARCKKTAACIANEVCCSLADVASSGKSFSLLPLLLLLSFDLLTSDESWIMVKVASCPFNLAPDAAAPASHQVDWWRRCFVYQRQTVEWSKPCGKDSHLDGICFACCSQMENGRTEWNGPGLRPDQILRDRPHADGTGPITRHNGTRTTIENAKQIGQSCSAGNDRPMRSGCEQANSIGSATRCGYWSGASFWPAPTRRCQLARLSLAVGSLNCLSRLLFRPILF